MKIEDLMKQVEQDFNITLQNYDKKIFDVPSLHAKYLNMLLSTKRKFIDLDISLKKLYKDKYYYYKTQHKYVLETQKEFDFHIFSDEEYSNLYKEHSKTKAYVEYLVEVVKKAQQLSFDCKNIVTVLQYQQGV